MNLDEKSLEAQLLSLVSDKDLIQKALTLTANCYENVSRDEGTPYIRHPIRVALILMGEAEVQDNDLVCAAVLHDLLEDCPEITFEAIQSEFGSNVARIVRCLTNEYKDADVPKHERRRRYLSRVAKEYHDCLLIKLCDRLDNLRSVWYSKKKGKREYMVRETRDHFLQPLPASSKKIDVLVSLLHQEVARLEGNDPS